MSQPEQAPPTSADPFLRLSQGGTEVVLIRHGDALRSGDDVELGGYDEQGLSQLGQRQAAAMAQDVAARQPVAIYSSPTRRAQETALPLAQALGLSVLVDDGLREVDLTRVRPAIPAEVPPAERAELLRRYLRGMEQQAMAVGKWSLIPGAESSASVRARITAAVDALAARHMGQRIVAVSHAGAINAYIAAFLGIERDFFFPIMNTAISTVRVRGSQHLLIELNASHHLRREEGTRLPN